MIFVTMGTSREFPFDRPLQAISDAVASGRITQPVIGQIGCATCTPCFEHKRFMSFSEISGHMQSANIIVAHAGVGSTLLTFSFDKTPILIPRLFSRGENLDDHQSEFTREMQKHGLVLAAFESDELLDLIDHFSDRVAELKREHNLAGRAELMAYLKTQIDALG